MYNKIRLNKYGNFYFNGENGVVFEYMYLDLFDKFEKKVLICENDRMLWSLMLLELIFGRILYGLLWELYI